MLRGVQMNRRSLGLKGRQAIGRSFQAYGAQCDLPAGRRPMNRRIEIALLCVFALAFWAIASKVPASGDDWAWGTEEGLQRLKSGFQGYNGRYLGNIIVLLLTRMGWFTPLLQAVGFAVIIVLVLDLTRNRTLVGYASIGSLVFLIPIHMWSESAVWVSGFANYASATIVMLIFLRAALKELSGQFAHPVRPVGQVGILAFAFISQLVVEHVTLYLFVASIGALAIDYLEQRMFSRRLTCWVLGFGAGAMVMFSNPAYRELSDGQSYKKLGAQSTSPLAAAKEALRDQISTNGMVSNTAVIFAICSLSALTAVVMYASGVGSLRARLVQLVLGLFALVGAVAAASRLTNQPVESGSTKTVLASAVVLVVVLWAVTLQKDAGDRLVIIVAVLSLLALSLPLLVVTPIGARNFLPSYALLLVVVSVLLSNLASLTDARVAGLWCAVMVAIGAVAWVHLYGIYSEIDHAADKRERSVRSQVGSDSPQWLQYPDPSNPVYARRFKVYYDVPKDVTVRLVR